ncbi:hypothetical protein [Burkholderia ambifaria]|jgi:hypothetical protein|uniref:defense against restriction DarA-related protein n=1 Tax=Burkholderia ambifaria TaxID=152480 RepID=UPI001589E7AA|nr:hypothetical protein [Burkholderia ambifaria]
MSTFDRIDQAAHAGAYGQNRLPEPSAAQQDAGNYKKGRVRVQGMPLVIENPRGSLRGWRAADGTSGTNLMKFHYGYFEGVRGADGDELDVFIGPWPEHRTAYVVNQHIRGAFDEHKVMLGFPDRRTAEAAYLSNYDRGWPGLGSCIACSVAQLKWWLLHGAKSKPLTRDQLPFEERNDMDKVIWDSAHQPRDCTSVQLLYEIRKHDGHEGLIFDPLTIADIEEDADGVLALDALVVPYLKLEQRMSILRKALVRAGGALDVTAFQTTKPFSQRGTTNVAVVFELSDGQTLSIFFHNPDVTPKKILPGDDLVSWKWMLNKKDVTIVVAPERGVDLNIRTVAQRIMTLAGKNSARFVAANAKRADRLRNIEQLKLTLEERHRELAGIEQEIAELTVSMESRYAAAVRETHDTQSAYIRATNNGGTDPETGKTADELAAETAAQAAAIKTMNGVLNDDGADSAGEPAPVDAPVVEPPVAEPAVAVEPSPAPEPEPATAATAEPVATPEPEPAPVPAAAPAAVDPPATPDLTYRTVDDMFTTFLPNTPAGEEAWKTIAEHTDGTGKVLHAQVESTVAQLREAGYTVAEAAPDTQSAISDDDLLAALAAPPAEPTWEERANSFGQQHGNYVGTFADTYDAERVKEASAGHWGFGNAGGMFWAFYSQGEGSYASGDMMPTPEEAYASMVSRPSYQALSTASNLEEPPPAAPPAGSDADVAYLTSIVDGTRDLTDEGIPTALRELHERRKDDAAVIALFQQAAEAYKAYAIERARAVLEPA